jgi:type I restriction enzyme, R subunit
VKALPRTSPIPPQTREQLKRLEVELAEKAEKLTDILGQKRTLDEELQRLRDEIAVVKKANSAILDTHDYTEEETRDYFVDLLLKEAGWPLDQKRDREFPVTGLPTEKGTGFVDYVLWGADGKPLGLVEAKRTRKDARIGEHQAKLYADCLEKQFGQRPIIFYSNGYEHRVWDDVFYPSRPVQGFFKRDELELLIQRRTARKRLSPLDIDPAIAERYYQTRAITRICEHFENDNMRKSLLVMATGSGKTRTVIALADLLMRANWAKPVLFLADRVALVRQAHKAFNAHLPNAGAVNLLNDGSADGRVMISTYPTMMKLIDERAEGMKRFSPAHFDLIVIDEAHRSVYQKYRAIFEYFDCFLVGLTAAPKEDIDRNTYSFFDLQSGVPTDVYGLDDAIADDYLVPPKPVSVPLKFMRGGIRYNDLSPEEQEEWDATDWSEDGAVPTEIDPNELNQWLFNKNTVDRVLQHLMERGEKVAGGDRLGKTIIFAKNRKHAHFIKERFDVHYPHFKGTFAAVIDYETVKADKLIEDFGKKDGEPHIAISVDMLDTGIDVPEVVNLVFFKLVRSKTKFWQMVGRGTRLCRDLYAPGQDKTHFWIFDYCENLEFFSQNAGTDKGSVAPSLSERLFNGRLNLIAELDRQGAEQPSLLPPGVADAGAAGEWVTGEQKLRSDLAARLMAEVTQMPLDNFLVRPKRKLVEHYAKPESWEKLGENEIDELSNEVAGLPSKLTDPELEAKLFDVLMLRLQLGRLRNDRGFPKAAERLRDIAAALESKAAIPMVADRMELILELQTDEFWQDVTVVRLETVRKQLRELVKFIEKIGQRPVYTDFEDEAGNAVDIDLPVGGGTQSFERFKEKVRHFLRPRERELALQKLRLGLALPSRT